MGSTIVHPRFGDAAAGSLALVAGLAVQEVMSKYLSAPHLALLKWPNDVMVGRAKLAGILMEREGEAVIIGIGVNLVSAPQLPDRDTVALAKFEQAPECDTFARELARVFDLELERWRNFGLAPIINRWLAAAHPLGTPLSIGEPGETPQTGTFAGLSPDGALQVRLADGTTQTLHAGEVRLAAP